MGDLNIAQRKNIIFHCIFRACHDETNGVANKCSFAWLSETLSGLYDEILQVLDVSTSALLDDIAIVPVELESFSHMDNECLLDLLKKLGFLCPNKYLGTCWWRIPREFKTSDIEQIVNLMKEAQELPSDADLSALCPLNGDALQIELDVDMSDVDMNNDNCNEKKEQSGDSEEEYQVDAVDESEKQQKKEERKKRKKEKKKKKRKKDKEKKSRKRKKK